MADRGQGKNEKAGKARGDPGKARWRPPLAITLTLFAALSALPGCRTVSRDIDHLAAAYSDAEPAQPVQIDTADGPVQMNVRQNSKGDKILVLLDTGAFKRALAKDFGSTATALPEAPFREAANRRLSETAGRTCEAAAGMQRQDYLWEFDVACRAPPPRGRK